MPSNSIESCAAVSEAEPSLACGQRNLPRSSRLYLSQKCRYFAGLAAPCYSEPTPSIRIPGRAGYALQSAATELASVGCFALPMAEFALFRRNGPTRHPLILRCLREADAHFVALAICWSSVSLWRTSCRKGALMDQKYVRINIPLL